MKPTNLIRFPVIAGSALALLLLASAPAAVADPVNSQMAVKVILGEAADQGLEGMIAVAEVIRNRGGLKGFSSMRRDLDTFAARQPLRVRRMAERAWRMSRYTNYTNGATHFDNVKRFGMPWWARDMMRTAVIADMHYFRER